jgi:EAL domain-containing protein (putative c-di-GMP-specific phosphodiesterase class I)
MNTVAAARLELESELHQATERDQVPENAHNSAIVQAIIALARTLNLQVIAEGLETQHQWQFLAEHGCTEMQRYIIFQAAAG